MKSRLNLIKNMIGKTWRLLLAYVIFLILLSIFFVRLLFRRFAWSDKLYRLMDRIDGKGEGEVSRIYLIELALKNLRAKKMRAFVTIGGMALGVGAVVFLVSLGYGLERLVISRVASLNELKIIDVGTGEVSQVKMNDDLVDKMEKIEGVEEVVPAVSMVAKIKYKNSVVDIMSMAVDDRYPRLVGAKILAGGEFQGLAGDGLSLSGTDGVVAGIQEERAISNYGLPVESENREYMIPAEEAVPVMASCDMNSEFLGYAIRQEGAYVGQRTWGKYFQTEKDMVFGVDKITGEDLSPWVRLKVPLWVKDEDGVRAVLGDNSYQKWATGCIRLDQLVEGKEIVKESLIDEDFGVVLGLTTDEEATPSAVSDAFVTVIATDSAGVEWIELKTVGGVDTSKKSLTFSGELTGEAYISSGMLRVFGLTADRVIGEKFGVSFIVPDSLLDEKRGRLESEQVDFVVKGVVDDEGSNYFYFHMGDAKKLGIKNYSQIKVVATSQDIVPKVRLEIETVGLRTVSTLDTVAEIEKLFRTIRTVLGMLGTIALAVAALGMFNTMTVSLLERTREVGVMKTMGMLSDDVRELFLAESMIMGVGGGACGVLVGVVAGKLLSFILTSVSVVKGQGVMDISFVPLFFVSFIMTVSFAVGIMTGWYPSRRARQISALNALRYE